MAPTASPEGLARPIEPRARPATAASRAERCTRTRRDTSSATASASSTRSTAAATRRSCSARPGPWCTRGSGRCRSPTSPATSGWSSSTRAATARATGRAASRHTPRPSSPRTRSTSSTRPAPRRRSSSASRAGPSARCCSPPSIPSGSSALVFIGPFFPASRSVGGLRWRLMTHPRLQPLFLAPVRSITRGWAKFNALLHPPRLPRLRRVVRRAGHRRGPLDQGLRGRGRRWALETDPETLILTILAEAAAPNTRRDQLALAGRVQCPVLVICGTEDRITPHADAKALAEATGGSCSSSTAATTSPRAGARSRSTSRSASSSTRRSAANPSGPRRNGNGRKRALYVSSPIGLGHARRDVAIARELRELVPDLEVDWLAQDPVTRVLEQEGERIHPASAHLANESEHLESESAEHDLHAFQALRRMDEILTANFMVFDDVVRERALRPLDRRRGLGARLPPAREPGARSARRSPG